MSRTHAEAHKRIKLIATEIDRLLTKLRAMSEEDEGAIRSEVQKAAETVRGSGDLSEWAAFLDAHAHLIARGGALALLQGAVGLATSSLVTLAAEEWALGRSWKVNWLRRTQRPREWSPGLLLRTVDLAGYRPAAWLVLPGGRLLGPGPSGGLRLQPAVGPGLPVDSAPERRAAVALLSLPGGGLLAASDDGSLQSWSLDPLAPQARQAGHPEAITALRASADGAHALTLGAEGALLFWSTSPLKKLNTIEISGRPPRVVELSPGASYAIAGFADGRVELLPTGEKGKHKVLEGHRAPVEGLLARKGLLISSDNRGEVRFWAMPSGEPLRALLHHRAPVGFLWLDEANQRLLTSSSDGQAALWSTETGELLGSAAIGHGGATAACTLPDGRLALGTAAGALLAVDLVAGTQVVVGFHEGPVSRVAAIEHSAVLSCGLDRAARLWLVGPHGAAPQRSVLGLDEEGLRALCVTTGNELELFDFAEGRRLRKIPLEPGVSPLPLLPQGRLLLDAAPPPLPPFASAPLADRLHPIRVVDVESLQTTATLAGHPLRARLAIADEQRRWIATATSGGEVKLWNFSDGACLLTLRGHDAPVLALAFEPEGIELYALYDGNEVCVWSTRSGKLMRRVPLQYAPEHPLTQLQAAGGRELVMAGSGGEVGRWDAESGRRTKGWKAHPEKISALALDPDGELVATGGDDRRLRLWKRSTGRLLTQYDFSGPVAGCRFLPDGRLAAWTSLGEPHYLKFIDWAQDDG
jgi:WD40 repeat protein